MKRRKTIISDCVCSCCGNKMFVPRSCGNKRERHHIKTMYCPFCKTERDMIENNY